MASWPAYSPRSTESPMDFEYTSRPSTSTAPAWASRGSEPTTPRKLGPLGETVTPTSPFPGTPHTPTFGRMHNVPFMMNMPPPEAPSTPAWDPHELKDIDMAEASPPQPHAEQNENENGNVYAESGGGRRIATGGMVRVFRSRQKYKEKERERSRLAVTRTRVQVEDEDENEDSGIESDEDDRNGRVTPITQNTSNHYTLNIPGPIAPQSETPYVLLGYLQFFFNSSLVLLFLYLLVLFILTVQRDVQHRISEYSMDNVQEITQCALHFKNNLCHSPIPAMVHQCGIWETCMNRDPTKIGRTKVVAEVIAEVINGFVEPITWKTLIFTLTSLAFLTLFINSLLSFYRSRYNPSTPPPHRQHHAPIHPYPYDSIPAIAPPYLAQGWGKSWMGVGEGKQWVGEGQQVEEGASRRRKLEGGRKEDVLVKS